MKKTLLALLIIIFALPMLAQNKYVGVNTCACHNMEKQGKQVDIWKKTKHAEAFNTLKSEKAATIAKGKGITVAASEAKECLDCHTTGYGDPQEKSFDMTKGVQCEACHGPASAYKPIHNKKENHDKAIAAGLKMVDEKVCKTCHVAKMHPVKDFDFKKMYDEIKHPLPKG